MRAELEFFKTHLYKKPKKEIFRGVPAKFKYAFRCVKPLLIAAVPDVDHYAKYEFEIFILCLKRYDYFCGYNCCPTLDRHTHVSTDLERHVIM